MHDQEISFAPLSELARGLRENEFTSVELTRLFLDRIARFDSQLHAYASVYAQSALLQAQAADLQRRAGMPLPALHGLPIAIKDLCEISGQITSAGSSLWQQRRSTTTSTVVERLLAAGMILLGKTNMVEFAFGGWGTNPHLGTPRNPWDMRTHRVPGGSSSGSGVAVAAALAPAAIGSDTGGSVRIPAAFNGLTGLKTTQGLISLHGNVVLSSSLDTIGPMTRTALDAGMLTAAIAGADMRDPRTLQRAWFESPASVATPASVRGLRIAVMPEAQYPWPVSPAVQAVTAQTVHTFAALGAQIETVVLPFDFAEMMRNNGAIIAAEAYAQHAAYIDDPALPIGGAVRQRMQGGKTVDARHYLSMLAQRRAAMCAFNAWMQAFDLLLTPSLPFEACPLSEVDETQTPAAAFNRAANYLDTCAISLPAGFSQNGLPIGVQLIAKPWHEQLLLQAGQAFQQETDWHRRRPEGLA